MVLQDPAWNPHTADVDKAVQAADERPAHELNATAADLSAFHARGGKLIVYHGWNDPAISPLNSVNYYNSVIKQMGAQTTDSFMRLYMVPGMEHCDGGPGPSSFRQLGLTTARAPEARIYTAPEHGVSEALAP